MQFTQTHTIKAIGESRHASFRITRSDAGDRASPIAPQQALGLVAVSEKAAHECVPAKTAPAESLAA